MSCPVTHTKNANQHPGQIVLDATQKRCTSEQKHQDGIHIEQEKNEQQSAHAHAIKWVAEIINEGTKAERSLLTTHWQPRLCKALPSQKQTEETDGLHQKALQ